LYKNHSPVTKRAAALELIFENVFTNTNFLSKKMAPTLPSASHF
ncbi:MAG: hypothetical protein ACI9XO_000966, partial [Paraglaciecola sp.]